MNFKELTREEQAKVRRLLRDEMRSIDVQPFPRIKELLAGRSDLPLDDTRLIEEVGQMWRRLEDALSSDFVLRPDMAQRIERDREQYLAVDDELGPLPDDQTDRRRLTRRIHHQRIELRNCERLLAHAWKCAGDDWLRQERWRKAHDEWLEASDDVTDDVTSSRDRLGRQRRALRRGNRLIEQQRAMLEHLLHRLIQQAATA